MNACSSTTEKAMETRLVSLDWEMAALPKGITFDNNYIKQLKYIAVKAITTIKIS